jgi:hypothetical protein
MRFFALVVALAACADRPLPLPEAIGPITQPDLASADLASADLPDLAQPDDLAAPDLNSSPDLASPAPHATGLTILAGRPGGPGNADDVGSDARLRQMISLAMSDDGRTAWGLEWDWTVRQIDIASGAVSTFLPPGSFRKNGQSCRPGSLALDGRGHLLVIASVYAIGDCARTVWRVDGAVSELGVLPWLRGFVPQAVHDAKTLYVASVDQLMAMDLDTGAARTIPVLDAAGQPIAFSASALAFDGKELLIGSMINPAAIAVDPASGAARPLTVSLAGTQLVIGTPAPATPRLVSGGHGKLFLFRLPTMVSPLYRDHDSLTEDPSDETLPAGISPVVLADDSAGDLLLQQIDNPVSAGELHLLVGAKLSPVAGLLSGPLFGGPGAASMTIPTALASDSGGLYALDSQQIFSIADETLPLLDPGVLQNPWALTRASDDLFYYCQESLGGGGSYPWLYAFRPSTNQVSVVLSEPFACRNSSLAVDGGQLWFADGGILSIDLGTGIASNLQADDIRAVTLDRGDLYVARGPSIARREADGSFTTIADGLVQPIALAADGKGALYVADPEDATVRKIDLGSGLVSILVGQPGVHGVKPGPLPGRLNRPQSLAITPSGDLAIGDGAEAVVLLVGLK